MSRDFTDLLVELDEGQTHEHLTAELRRLVQAVQETNKAGALVLTLNVKKSERGKTLIVNPKVVVKIPTPSSNATMFYATEEGSLQREDPRQMTLKHVGGPSKGEKPLRTVKRPGKDAEPAEEEI